MSKQTIYVRHKDEIIEEIITKLSSMAGQYEFVMSDYDSGYICALKWVVGMHKTKEQKDQEFSDKIDEITKSET